jgi:nucleotide-binding universal stress UspA family protein
MIRRILLPVDASDHSRAAARHAVELAKAHNAVIYALGVVDVPGIVRSSTRVGAGASQYGKEMMRSSLDDAHRVLGEFLDELKEEIRGHGIKCKRIQESGPVHKTIALVSRTTDLVVVARDTNFEFETSSKPGHALFELLEITSRLTLVVPDAPRQFKRIVVAHDLSASCARMLYMLVHLNPFPEAEIVVVHAGDEGMADKDGFQNITGYLAEHGFEASVVVRDLRPDKAILEVADEREADAIVMGAYDVGKVRRILFGSTAQRILDRANVPLVFGT